MNKLQMDIYLLEQQINELDNNLQMQISGTCNEYEQYTKQQILQLNYKLDSLRFKLMNKQNEFNYIQENTANKKDSSKYLIFVYTIYLIIIAYCIFTIVSIE